MTAIMGVLGIGSARATGGPGAAPGPDAGFAGLVDEMELTEAPPDTTPQTEFATDASWPEAEPETTQEIPLSATPESAPVPVSTHPFVARSPLPTGEGATESGVTAPVAGSVGAPTVPGSMPQTPEAGLSGTEDARPAMPAMVPDGTDSAVAGSSTSEGWLPVGPATRLDPGNAGKPGPTSEGPHPASPVTVGQTASPLSSSPATPPAGDAAHPLPGDAVASAGQTHEAPALANGLLEMPTGVELLYRAARFGVRVERVAPTQGSGAANLGVTPDVAGRPVTAAPGPTAVQAAPAVIAPDSAAQKTVGAPAEGATQPAAAPTLAAGPEGQLSDLRSDLPSSPMQTAAQQAVAAAPAPPPSRSPLVMAALERVLPATAVAGETILRLSPQGLGLIEVVVQESHDGILDVTLRVQNPLVLDALRQDRDAVAQALTSAQGGAAGSLSMDLFHSGTGQRGAEPDAHPFHRAAAEASQETIEPLPDEHASQILRADHVNIVT